jgi:hypothetical protein
MNIRSLCASIGFAALSATAGVGVAAASSSPAAAVSIPFANHGGIRNWEADRDRGLWVQDSRRNWYYAKLMGPCIGLDFALSIGFDTRPMGSFDRFSSIVVPREGRCLIQSFVPSEGPPTRQKAKAQVSGSAS